MLKKLFCLIKGHKIPKDNPWLFACLRCGEMCRNRDPKFKDYGKFTMPDGLWQCEAAREQLIKHWRV